jgi:hypothetical protein
MSFAWPVVFRIEQGAMRKNENEGPRLTWKSSLLVGKLGRMDTELLCLGLGEWN